MKTELMLVLQVVLLVVALVNIVDSKDASASLTELIKRVHIERDKAAFFFINFDEDFLSTFLRGNPGIPVSILNDPEVAYTEFTNAVFVIQGREDQTFHNDTLLDTLMAKLQVRRDVIVSAGSLNNLEECFSFLADKKFTRILGIAGDNTSYAYFPYADTKVQELSPSGPLPQPLKDLNGFNVRTTIKQDIPRLFPYIDDEGRLQIGGSIAKIFISFLQKHNATFREIENKNFTVTISDILRATAANEIDISMNAYVPKLSCGWSYPIKVVTVVLMVPINGFVDPHEYFIRPFSLRVWICIGLFLIYVTLSKVLLNRGQQRTAGYWQSFSETFSAMLMLSPERTITNNYRLHLQIFLFTFLIGNIYVIFFTSFMTAFIPIKQFDTIQDLVDNNFKILSTDFDKKYFTEAYSKDILDLMITVDIKTYAKELLSMKNTSFGYIVSNDKREFLINLQSAVVKPLFRTAKETLNFFFISFFLPPHSTFKDILDDFIISIQETGLAQKWDSDTLFNIRREGWGTNILYSKAQEQIHVSLNVGHLKFAWTAYGIGLVVAVLVFLGERFGDKIF